MRNKVAAAPVRGSLPPSAPETEVLPFYETSCGLCGAQIHFRDPLISWTKVYCPGCGEYVAVR